MQLLHTITNAEGFSLGYGNLNVYRLIGRVDGLVRVQVGPGFADFEQHQIYATREVPGFGWVVVIHPTQRPVAADNPFAAGYAAVSTALGRAIDRAIDAV